MHIIVCAYLHASHLKNLIYQCSLQILCLFLVGTLAPVMTWTISFKPLKFWLHYINLPSTSQAWDASHWPVLSTMYLGQLSGSSSNMSSTDVISPGGWNTIMSCLLLLTLVLLFCPCYFLHVYFLFLPLVFLG